MVHKYTKNIQGRVSIEQAEFVERAAKKQGTNVNAYVGRVMLEDAARVLREPAPMSPKEARQQLEPEQAQEVAEKLRQLERLLIEEQLGKRGSRRKTQLEALPMSVRPSKRAARAK